MHRPISAGCRGVLGGSTSQSGGFSCYDGDMDELQNKIIAAVDAAFEAQLSALQALVDQPSHTFARADVEEASSLLDHFAEQAGLKSHRHRATDPQFADHRVYTTPGLGAADRAVALVGHIDTVHPRSSGFVDFSRDEVAARGPGVLDMKSGLTAALFALSACRDVLGSYDNLAARLVCVTDEEVGSPTSRDLYDQLAPSISSALVFEKGRDEDRIITCRKGGGTFRVVAHGRAVHAGNDHANGLNAIHALALLVPHFEAVTDYERGITVNVGVFEGGTAKNTVPDQASIVIDARFVEADTVAEVQRKFEEIIATPMPARLTGVRFELTGKVTRPPMEKTAENEALRLEYERHAAAVGLKVGEAPRQGGFSDSNLLAAHGIPTIDGLGPFGKGDHSKDEWCSLDSLRRRTQALALFLAASTRP